MRNVDSIFSFALRFHPDIVDLSPNEFRRSCYIHLLCREPETDLPEIFFPTFEERARYWGDMVNSREFSAHSLSTDDLLSRICRSLGWQFKNSASHYACRYVVLTSASYSVFVERIVAALSLNSISRADIIHTIDSYSDVALIRSLLDGLIDMSAEFAMAIDELNLVKERLSALETEAMRATSLLDTAPPEPAAPEASESILKTSHMYTTQVAPTVAKNAAKATNKNAAQATKKNAAQATRKNT